MDPGRPLPADTCAEVEQVMPHRRRFLRMVRASYLHDHMMLEAVAGTDAPVNGRRVSPPEVAGLLSQWGVSDPRL